MGGSNPMATALFHQQLHGGLFCLFRGETAREELDRAFSAPPEDDGPPLTQQEAAVLSITLSAMRDGRPVPMFDSERYLRER